MLAIAVGASSLVEGVSEETTGPQAESRNNGTQASNTIFVLRNTIPFFVSLTIKNNLVPNETVEKLFVDECRSLGPSGLSHWMGHFLSKNPPIPVDFTNIVDESEQLPLDIHLGFRTDGEMVQPFLHAEIRKNRLHDRQTSGVYFPAFGCVDAGLHVFDQVGMQTVHLNG